MKPKSAAAVPPPGSGVYLVALGCPKNFVDSEVIAGSLAAAGWPLLFGQNQETPHGFDD